MEQQRAAHIVDIAHTVDILTPTLKHKQSKLPLLCGRNKNRSELHLLLCRHILVSYSASLVRPSRSTRGARSPRVQHTNGQIGADTGCVID